jgi:hypothetical protein
MVEPLERTVAQLKVVGGEPLAKPVLLSVPPKTEPDSLTLHLTARYLPAGKGWARMPAEDWVVLERAEWMTLLPAEGARIGTSWDIDKEVAAKLLSRFYPPSSTSRAVESRTPRQALKATLMSVKDGVARARIDGSVTMKRPFLPLPDYYLVEATVVGFVDIDLSKKRLQSVRLVTDKATFVGGTFAVAVRSVP